MGYKHSYSIVEAYRQVRAAGTELNNPRNDGFISWGIKQDLYQLKWFLDDILKNSTDFGDTEKTWLKEQEQKKIIRILKDEV